MTMDTKDVLMIGFVSLAILAGLSVVTFCIYKGSRNFDIDACGSACAPFSVKQVTADICLCQGRL